jgi:hypothetical protein
MKEKIKLTQRDYELLEQSKKILERKKEISKPIVASNFKKSKEELSKNPAVQNIFKLVGIKIK